MILNLNGFYSIYTKNGIATAILNALETIFFFEQNWRKYQGAS